MAEDLTDRQQNFIELLFEDEYLDNPKGAALAAGYSERVSVSQILNSEAVKKAILNKVDSYILASAAKSVKGILEVLQTPSQQGAKAKLEAAAMLLDRAGITKKERVELEVKSTNAILILPSKKDT